MGNTQKLAPVQLTPEVIEAINEELSYQTTLPSTGRADCVEHGVAGQLVTLATYARKAEDAWTLNPGDDASLDVLRKVAAIAARALLIYGCPRRVIQEPKGVQMLGGVIANAGAIARADFS